MTGAIANLTCNDELGARRVIRADCKVERSMAKQILSLGRTCST